MNQRDRLRPARPSRNRGRQIEEMLTIDAYWQQKNRVWKESTSTKDCCLIVRTASVQHYIQLLNLSRPRNTYGSRVNTQCRRLLFPCLNVKSLSMVSDIAVRALKQGRPKLAWRIGFSIKIEHTGSHKYLVASTRVSTLFIFFFSVL